MKKETFIKSTIILMIGGLLTKLLGILIKVIMTRNSSIDVISLYMLVMPTFSLMMAISQLGFATGISKVVSENKDNIVNKNINTYESENSIDIYVTYEVLENIGTNEKIVF